MPVSGYAGSWFDSRSGSQIQEPHSDVGLFVLIRNSGNTAQKIDPFLAIKVEY
jgi:hypothetical protein